MVNQAWLNGVRDELLYRAKRLSLAEATVGYSELAEKFGMPLFGGRNRVRYKEHPLHDILRELDKEDTKDERPFLSALVIHATDDRLPGVGFFKTLAEFRRLSNPISKPKRHEYWSKEVNRLIEFYQGSPKSDK